MRRVLLLIILACISYGVWSQRERIIHLINSSETQADPDRYTALCADLKVLHDELSIRFSEAESPEEKSIVITKARELLNLALPEMMRCWIGTQWDFDGTSETPGEGKIACGYYVSTILRDAGFDVPRIKLAQQASETILQTFVPTENYHRRIGMDYQSFITELSAQPTGISIIGLDTHVSFIVHSTQSNESLSFLHASGSYPYTVVEELPDQAKVIKRSNYRIYGNMTAEDSCIIRWLTKQPFLLPNLEK